VKHDPHVDVARDYFPGLTGLRGIAACWVMLFHLWMQAAQPSVILLGLDLTPTQDELMAAFSKGHRADIRRAERDGVTIRVGTPEADADVLHQMLVATNQRKSFGFHSAAYYRRLLHAFGDGARLQVAEIDGTPIGASLILAWGRHGTYLSAGSNAAGLEHRAAHLLQWHAIQWAKQRGATSWDLWGIADARGRFELASADGADQTRLAALEAEAKRDPSRLLLFALDAEPPAAGVRALQAAIIGPERVRAVGRHAYIFFPDGQGQSKLSIAIMRSPSASLKSFCTGSP
jgi:hypothetical protein